MLAASCFMLIPQLFLDHFYFYLSFWSKDFHALPNMYVSYFIFMLIPQIFPNLLAFKSALPSGLKIFISSYCAC